MAKIDAAKLAELGFTDDVPARSNSVVVSIAGMEGVGKTTWALTAPKPLLYIATDFGEEGVVQKATGQIVRPKGLEGEPGSFKLIIPHELRPFVDKEEKADARKVREGKLANYVHDNFYVPFFDAYKKGLDAGVKSVVWDNALDVWEWTRVSVYGRNATNRSDLQAEANSKFTEMVRMANAGNVNLIMINHLKPAWESYYDEKGNIKWRKTANDWEEQGFTKSPFLVSMNLWLHRDKKTQEFQIEIKKCRDNASFVGQKLPSMPFHDLMAMLVPEVSDWDA
jgi:hypothetical protein